jgi:hypothetical protein
MAVAKLTITGFQLLMDHGQKKRCCASSKEWCTLGTKCQLKILPVPSRALTGRKYSFL